LSNLDDFKYIADNMIKDIKVSDALKEKTLKSCKKSRYSNRRYVIMPAAALAIAASLVLAVLNPSLIQLLSNRVNPDNNPGGVTIMVDPIGGETDGDDTSHGGQDNPGNTEVKVTETPGVDGQNPVDEDGNPDDAVSSDGGAVKILPVNVEGAQTFPGSAGAGTGPIYRPGSLEEAQSYMGGELRLPQYIPSGFVQELIEVPVDMDKAGMDVTVTYKSGSKLFSLTLNRIGVDSGNFISQKEVDINGVKGQLFSGKLMTGSKEISSSYTQLRWLKDGVLYIMEGQISEKESVKVARSIK
jgi:hypothetical protein